MELLCLEKEGEQYSIADPVFLDDDRVLSNLLFLESKYCLKESYFETIQKDLTASMRKEVSIWLLEVCMEEQCEEEVFPTAICIMDRFLSLVQIQKSQLQLLATTCLLLSSKLVQNKTITPDRLVMFTDYSVTSEEIRSWEYLVLGELGWDVHAVIPNNFLDLILRRLIFINSNKRTIIQKHAELFISLCASEFQFFNYLPSVIASACLALVLDIHCYKENLNEILDCIQQVTKIESKIIEDTIDLLEDLIPSNRFHSTKNQSKRKRKNKDRQLINLNNDSDSDLDCNELQINNEFLTESSSQNAIKSCSNQNLNNINNLSCTNHDQYSLTNSSSKSEILNCSDNSCSSPINHQRNDDNQELILKHNCLNDENDLVLIDLTCFETPPAESSICCNLVSEKVF